MCSASRSGCAGCVPHCGIASTTRARRASGGRGRAMSPSTATASSQGSFRAAKPVCQHLQERASPCLGLAGGGARLFMLAAMGRPKQVARILLVEDDESFSVLVRAYLRAMAADDKPPLATLPHYSSVPKLDAVGTLAAAREQLAARHYDLVLLDLHLPDSSGIDTLRAIRGEGERLIIVMTADEDPERSEERRVGKESRSRWEPYHG